jgi:hypothetical protein
MFDHRQKSAVSYTSRHFSRLLTLPLVTATSTLGLVGKERREAWSAGPGVFLYFFLTRNEGHFTTGLIGSYRERCVSLEQEQIEQDQPSRGYECSQRQEKQE